MKVLFVLDRLQDGGAQVQPLDLAVGLVERGIACRVVALYSEPVCTSHAGIESIGLGISTAPRSFPSACLRVLDVCRQERPDLVHSHAEVPNLACRFVCRWLGLPHVVTAHCENPWHWRPRLGRFLERRTAFLTRRYFAVSRAVGRVLQHEVQVPADRIRVIPNWPPRRSESIEVVPMPPRGSPTIVNVARLHRQKRQDVLIEAFREVQRSFPDAVLWIAGTGPEEPRLRGMAGNGVVLLGQRRDVPQLLRAADLFVLSSDWEGMPLSVLEAMREGVPIVSTEVAGIPDLLGPGECGMMVPRGNPAVLAAAMVECLRDPDRSRAMGERGRIVCDGLRDDSVASYVAAYEEVLGDVSEAHAGRAEE